MDVWFSLVDLIVVCEYICYVQMWVWILNVVVIDLGEVVFEGLGESVIKVFVVVFVNGKCIIVLLSNFKGFWFKGGKVVFDEFVFYEDVDEFWWVVVLLVLWGYFIWVFFLYNGKDCCFYQMVQEVQQVDSKWMLYLVIIVDVICDGLVECIMNLDCLVIVVEVEVFLVECWVIVGDDEMFQQEFMCNFLDGMVVYISYVLFDVNVVVEVFDFIVILGSEIYDIFLFDYCFVL